MESKKLSVVALVAAVAGLVLAVGVMTVFSACGPKEDGTWMHCHDVQMGIMACGVVVTVAMALAAFLKGKAVRIVLCAVAIAACVVVLALPSVMPMCMVDTMRCHAVMTPFARIMATIAGVLGIVALVQAARSGKKDLPRYGQL